MPQRIARVVTGQLIIAAMFCALLRAHLGLGPLFVLQQGISLHTPLSIGMASIALGVVLFATALLLRERPGFGTLASVVLTGVFIDLLMPLFPDWRGLPLRVAMCFVGIVVMTFGGALYMSADLGASPYDAVMTGIFRRVPFSLYAVRLAMEAVACLLGWLAGGEVGVGSVIVGVVVGPSLQFWLRVLRATPEKLHQAPEAVGEAALAGAAAT
jgi:uncharacterized membrane protein YczE